MAPFNLYIYFKIIVIQCLRWVLQGSNVSEDYLDSADAESSLHENDIALVLTCSVPLIVFFSK